MARPVRFSEAGFRVEAERSAEGAVRRGLLPDPTAALSGGAAVKRNLYRAASRVELPGVGAVLLKVHRPRGLVDTVRAALRRSRARSEWDAARYLVGAGIPTPAPLAVLERRRGPLLEQAASAARFVAPRETFAPSLTAQPPDKARALAARSGRLLRALHDRGVSHGDFHSGNLLVGPGPGDRCVLDVVDLHTVRAGRPVTARRRRAQLAQWVHSLAGVLGAAGRRRVVVGYLGDADAATVRCTFARVERLVAARERRRLRSRGRRCVEESSVYTSDLGDARGWRRRDLPVEAIERALAAHDAALARGGDAVLKRHRKGAVVRAGGVVVKEAFEPGLARRLEARLLPRRRRAGYENAHRLAVRGVGTAAPLAFVRRGGRTFTLYEDLGRLPRLDHWVIEAARTRRLSRARRLAALHATADFAAGLHRRGVWHGDLKACNWLVEETGTHLAFRLVDTDRVRFLRRVSRERRLRNLAQLAASVPRAVTRTDRLRWWRRYARGTPWAGAAHERAVARDVAALLARKLVVVDEPIE